MMERMDDRAGLTATGLRSLALRDVRAWLRRVRAEGLDSGQSASLLRLLFCAWLIALFAKALGAAWDVAWHFRWLRHDLAPPHAILLAGTGLAVLLVLWHGYTRFGVDRVALKLMIAGLSVTAVFIPIDAIAHRIFGLDITTWSISHFGLYSGTTIMITGVIRAWRLRAGELPRFRLMLGVLWFLLLENVVFPSQQQEYGILAIRAFAGGHPTADAELLEFARNQAGVRTLDLASATAFALPIPAWVYPVWLGGAAMLTLVAARLSLGLRWTATTIAAAYVGWRCLTWLLLSAGGFPHSTVPFLLVPGGAAIDLVCKMGLPPLAEAGVGAVLGTGAIYSATWLQSSVLAAPPVLYASAPVAAALLFGAWAVLCGLRARRGLLLF